MTQKFMLLFCGQHNQAFKKDNIPKCDYYY